MKHQSHGRIKEKNRRKPKLNAVEILENLEAKSTHSREASKPFMHYSKSSNSRNHNDKKRTKIKRRGIEKESTVFLFPFLSLTKGRKSSGRVSSSRRRQLVSSSVLVLATLVLLLHIYVLCSVRVAGNVFVYIASVVAVRFMTAHICQSFPSARAALKDLESTKSLILLRLMIALVSLGFSVILPLSVSYQSALSKRTSSTLMNHYSINSAGKAVDTNSDPFPYIVSLIDRNGHQVCSGSLIAPNIVLSAASCSLLFLTGILGNNGDFREINGFVMHPNWSPGNNDNDLILFRLSAPINTESVFLYDGCSPILEERAKLKAFHWEGDSTKISTVVATSSLEYLSTPECFSKTVEAGQSEEKARVIVNSNTICAQTIDGESGVSKSQLGSPIVSLEAQYSDFDKTNGIATKHVAFGIVTKQETVAHEGRRLGYHVDIAMKQEWISYVVERRWGILLPRRIECSLPEDPGVNWTSIYFALFVVFFYIFQLTV